MMKTIGITGGIGSGKSTISAILRRNGFDIIDADKIAREILKTDGGGKLLSELVETFGSDIIKDGQLDRKKLANIAFSSVQKKEKLDAIMMPAIIKSIQEHILQLEKNGDEIAFLDAPLLFENKLDFLCFEIWVVYADEETRIARVMSRDKVSEKDVRMRMKFQMRDSEKIEHADFVIENSKDEMYLEEQIKSRLKELLNQ